MGGTHSQQGAVPTASRGGPHSPQNSVEAVLPKSFINCLPPVLLQPRHLSLPASLLAPLRSLPKDASPLSPYLLFRGSGATMASQG